MVLTFYLEVLLSILAAVATYFLLFKLMFADLTEFQNKLKSTVLFFPIGAALDLVSSKESLRVWVWLPSGLIVGIFVYRLLSH